MNIIIAIIILSIIVIIHEFGHFIVAKANGIAVSEFALGLGPTILKFKKKEHFFLSSFCRLEEPALWLGRMEVRMG